MHGMFSFLIVLQLIQQQLALHSHPGPEIGRWRISVRNEFRWPWDPTSAHPFLTIKYVIRSCSDQRKRPEACVPR
jgi:hypothetical protein